MVCIYIGNISSITFYVTFQAGYIIYLIIVVRYVYCAVVGTYYTTTIYYIQ
jgi:hypothetical protein